MLVSLWILIEWLSSSIDPSLRNMRLMTEFESCWLSEYLVRMQLVGSDSSRRKESAMSIRVSLWIKWCGKLRSQLLFLMLKLPVMIMMLSMLTLVSLKYFKAIFKESEYILIKKYTSPQLKKETQEISLWLKTSFHSKKQRENNLVLI